MKEGFSLQEIHQRMQPENIKLTASKNKKTNKALEKLIF